MTKDYLVVADACVLVSASIRDTLLRLAEEPRLYVVRWSDCIIKEMVSTLEKRFNKTPQQTTHLVTELKKAFPEAWIYGYERLIPSMTNHEGDRHVLAAAVKAGAQTIVTFNLKHFGKEHTTPLDIEAISPDEFLLNQYHLDKALVTFKITTQASEIGKSVPALLQTLKKGVPQFAQTLADALRITLD